MRKTYSINNSKDFHGAPLNRTAPFPEKGSLFEFYGTWIKTEDLIRELVDTTADIIITALYDLSRELKDDIWKQTNLKFYIETLASTGYDRTLAWYIGFDSSHKVLLGSLHIFEQTLLIKSELNKYEISMINTLENSFDRAYAGAELAILNKIIERDKFVNRVKHKLFGYTEEETKEYTKLEEIADAKQAELEQLHLDYDILIQYLNVYNRGGRYIIETRIEDFYKERPIIQLYT